MIERLDHLVLTVRDLDETLAFYVDVLGMERVTFGGGRTGLRFGHQKINLHEAGREPEPKATHPTPGSADLCFVASIPLDEVAVRLREAEVEIVEGPVDRTGAVGPIRSLYCRDLDGNLIEIAHYIGSEPS